MIVDYHMHLRDADEELDHTTDAVEPYVEAARVAGVDEIGFTEHVYYFRQLERLWDVPYQIERCRHDLDTYCDAVGEAKRRGLPVKLGLEVDYVRGREDELRELLEPYPWDFLLGSVHWIDGEAVDQRPGLWGARSVEEVWALYFDRLRAAAQSGLFDSLSHPDLVKIYGMRPPPSELERHHRETADALPGTGVAVEVSTAGLRKPVGELYPDLALLEACRKRVIPITTGSDAHVALLVGRDFDRSLELARRVGYDTVTVFDGRCARQEPLA